MKPAGKYDDLCTAARKTAGAAGCLLIIIGGDKGSGFSAQLMPGLSASVPDLLREVPAQIERDAKGMSAPHG